MSEIHQYTAGMLRKQDAPFSICSLYKDTYRTCSKPLQASAQLDKKRCMGSFDQSEKPLPMDKWCEYFHLFPPKFGLPQSDPKIHPKGFALFWHDWAKV